MIKLIDEKEYSIYMLNNGNFRFCSRKESRDYQFLEDLDFIVHELPLWLYGSAPGPKSPLPTLEVYKNWYTPSHQRGDYLGSEVIKKRFVSQCGLKKYSVHLKPGPKYNLFYYGPGNEFDGMSEHCHTALYLKQLEGRIRYYGGV